MGQHNPANMVEIARVAGVSQSTVSRALTNHPLVAAATRKRIVEIAEKLGYHPNPMVSTLMANIRARRPISSHPILAYVTAHKTRDGWKTYMSDFYEGARKRSESLGYSTEIFWFHEPGMTPTKFSTMLYTRGIQGVLIAPFDEPESLELDWHHFSAVAICYTLRSPSLSMATTDHYQNMLLVIHRLRALGYKKIALMLDREGSSRNHHRWLSAYVGFQHNLPRGEQMQPFFESKLDLQEVVHYIKKNKPDALISPYSNLIDGLRNLGVKIPGELGYASLNVEDRSIDPVAGVVEHHKLSAAASVDLIIGQLQRNEQGIPVNPKLTLITGTWQDGSSVRRLNL